MIEWEIQVVYNVKTKETNITVMTSCGYNTYFNYVKADSGNFLKSIPEKVFCLT